MFKPGDRVRCVKPDEVGMLDKGKVYIVEAVHSAAHGYMVTLEGQPSIFKIQRFEAFDGELPVLDTAAVKAALNEIASGLEKLKGLLS